MTESYTVVGQRGQITIPKEIRKKFNIKEKDKLLIKLQANNIIVKKTISDKKINSLMKKGYENMAKIDKKTVEDFKYVDSEVNKYLGEY